MAKHFPRNWVSAPQHCNKCNRQTQHKLWFGKTGGGIIGHCLDCAAKAERERLTRPEAAPVLQREFKF
jgi:hypothetical protein